MKNIEVSSTNFFCGLVLAFLLGIGFSQFIINAMLRDNIPPGIYAPLVLGRGFSFQVNVTETIKKDKVTTTWLREDHTTWVQTETGLIATTVFSQITVDCATKKVSILEQRAFGPKMTFIGSAKGEGVSQDPKSITGVAGIIALCAAEISDEQSKKQRTDETSPAPSSKPLAPHYPGMHEA